MMASNQTKELLFSATVEGDFGYTKPFLRIRLLQISAVLVRGAFGWGGEVPVLSDPEEELTAVLLIQQPVRQVQN